MDAADAVVPVLEDPVADDPELLEEPVAEVQPALVGRLVTPTAPQKLSAKVMTSGKDAVSDNELSQQRAPTRRRND